MKRSLASWVVRSALVASGALWLALASACDNEIPRVGVGQYCQNDDRCLEGLLCISRTCQTPPRVIGEPPPDVDAGPPPVDAGPTPDAGPRDAGPDAGPDLDAGSDAAVEPDAGVEPDGG